MTRFELRASVSLAAIFALRMLGLFLILPVFAVHARGMAGGSDATLVGLALGIYGLVQALLQLPLGMASDRVGRKPVIVAGLLVFAVGSFVAALAEALASLDRAGRRPKLLYTVPNYQNPAGVSLAESRRDEIVELAARLHVQAVYANHDDDPYALARDARVRGALADLGIALHTSKDHVIF
ncbi:MAG: MFS transporter, partial [Gammaproteobacteria bacterium]